MTRIKRIGINKIATTVAIAWAAVLATATLAGARSAPANAEESPTVDVVFVLDTTGSMGGLIEGAKLKIWSIANQIIGGSPTPDLRVGLVGYRDKGDEYVTQVFDLSSDLDEVYAHLMSFRAGGGGDGPEHVNRALHDAVNDISWSGDRRTLRILFLVGDAPPHVDYDDGYDFNVVCETAVRKDIIVNTIQCGAVSETAEYWRQIARLGEGEYAAIPQSGGMRSIPTPMDEELTRLSRELDATVVAFGDAKDFERKRDADEMAAEMPAAALAERAAFKSTSGKMGTYDLIDALESGKVELEEIEKKNLPEEMRDMNTGEMQVFLEQKRAKRDDICKRIAKLNTERGRYIKAKLAEGGGEDSFDAQVLTMIRTQAGDKGLTY
jgi:Mg-chelatase subunit ChlD